MATSGNFCARAVPGDLLIICFYIFHRSSVSLYNRRMTYNRVIIISIFVHTNTDLRIAAVQRAVIGRGIVAYWEKRFRHFRRGIMADRMLPEDLYCSRINSDVHKSTYWYIQT